MLYVIGHPELGQSSEKGFDCSGFARFVLTQAGICIPDYIGIGKSVSKGFGTVRQIRSDEILQD